MGKKKQKFVHFKPDIYSIKLNKIKDGLFSDVEIVLNDKTIKLHKNILASGSEYFSNIFKEEVSSTSINEDDVLFNTYINFLYTGCLDVTNEEKLFDFLLLALKYKTKELSNLQIPSKKLLGELIQFAEKDNKNVEVFEKLLLSINFKKNWWRCFRKIRKEEQR